MIAPHAACKQEKYIYQIGTCWPQLILMEDAKLQKFDIFDNLHLSLCISQLIRHFVPIHRIIYNVSLGTLCHINYSHARNFSMTVRGDCDKVCLFIFMYFYCLFGVLALCLSIYKLTITKWLRLIMQ